MLFHQIARKLHTVWRLPYREKLWVLLLYPYSGIVRASLYLFHFKVLSQVLGQHYQNHTLSPLVSKSQRMRAWRIGQIVELTARYTPWESKCLVQAVMARTLLGFYGIPYIIHVGALMTHDDKDPLKAHAWVKVGALIIAGREGHQAFAIVSSFVSKSLLNHDE
jgi:Transglutaminase-like superfamily